MGAVHIMVMWLQSNKVLVSIPHHLKRINTKISIYFAFLYFRYKKYRYLGILRLCSCIYWRTFVGKENLYQFTKSFA